MDAAMGGDGVVSFPVGVNGQAERGKVVIHGEPYAIAARAQFRLDEEGRDVLFLDVFFLEAPSVRRLKIIRTGEDSILVRFLEYPSVEEAARMLLTLVGGDAGASGGVGSLWTGCDPAPSVWAYEGDLLPARRRKAASTPCVTGVYAAGEPVDYIERWWDEDEQK